ncbi:hypothetical protein GGR51DRAFT_562213 [Nemania sp. FL0031]|nr:hypothetical protein GGR51DRAFT_562213 [Nemania sp. FL0031]
MDTTETPTRPIVRGGIHEVSWDLMLYLCDHLDAFGLYRIALLTKFMWTTLQFSLYRKAAEYRRGQRYRGRLRNIITWAIQHNADIKTVEMMIEACKPVWPCWISGHDNRKMPPPLFIAIQKNRTDVAALLLANGAKVDTTYMWTVQKERWDLCRLYPHGFYRFRPGLRSPKDNDRFDPECDSVLEMAIQYRNMELTERFIADPRVPVRQAAFMRALSVQWKFGIEAVLACDRHEEFRMEHILDREIVYCSRFNQPDWLEYLVLLGANPEQNPEYPPDNQQIGKTAGTPIGISIEKGYMSNVTRLITVFPFTWEYLVHVLLLCVEHDDRLDATKILLAQTCWDDGWAWMEAYAHGLHAHNYQPGVNIKTMRFLVEYLQELIEQESEFDINKELMYARQPGMGEDDWTEFWHYTLVQHAMMNTVYQSGTYDWVRPLFHLDVDATKFLYDNAGELHYYKLYLAQFVHTRQDFDELLSLYRQPKIDIDAVFDVDGKRDRDRGLFKLDSLENDWERHYPYSWEIESGRLWSLEEYERERGHCACQDTALENNWTPAEALALL